MRITGLEVLRLGVNRRGDWLFVRLWTDAGLSGIGEASHGGPGREGDAVVTALLENQCGCLLRGRDPRDVLAATTALQPLVHGWAGATAVSACEQALWDLAGQAAGLPVYQLLSGGPARAPRIPLYANINRSVAERTPGGFARAAAAAAAQGFRAVKCAPFDAVQQQRRGVSEGDQQERVAQGIACVAAVRDAVGASVEVFVDCHGRLDEPTAAWAARKLCALGVTWFEEPVPTEDRDALVRLRPLVRDAGMELIGGERLYGVDGFQPYLAAGVWDLIMPDVKHCGGIAALGAIAAAARARGVAVSPHNPSGPVANIASAHAAAALPPGRLLEYAWGEVPWRAGVITPPECIEAGELVLPSGPGLGVALDEAAWALHKGES